MIRDKCNDVSLLEFVCLLVLVSMCVCLTICPACVGKISVLVIALSFFFSIQVIRDKCNDVSLLEFVCLFVCLFVL